MQNVKGCSKTVFTEKILASWRVFEELKSRIRLFILYRNLKRSRALFAKLGRAAPANGSLIEFMLLGLLREQNVKYKAPRCAKVFSYGALNLGLWKVDENAHLRGIGKLIYKRHVACGTLLARKLSTTPSRDRTAAEFYSYFKLKPLSIGYVRLGYSSWPVRMGCLSNNAPMDGSSSVMARYLTQVARAFGWTGEGFTDPFLERI